LTPVLAPHGDRATLVPANEARRRGGPVLEIGQGSDERG